jgi:hypothetical protein
MHRLSPKRRARRLIRGGAVLVALAACATAIASEGPTQHATSTLRATFRVDFVGTNQTHWTLSGGAAIDDGSCAGASWPVNPSSGSQTVRLTTAGLGSPVNAIFDSGDLQTEGQDEVVYRGSTQDLHAERWNLTLAMSIDRTGTITFPTNACGQQQDLQPIGGSGPGCGHYETKVNLDMGFLRSESVNPQAPKRPLGPKDGLSPTFGHDAGLLSYGHGDLCDRPAAGLYPLGLLPPYSPYPEAGPEVNFLPYKTTGNDVSSPYPAFAQVPLKQLFDCTRKTISIHYSPQSEQLSGPFTGSNDPGVMNSPGWAHWHATATLEWTMTLHRIGCNKKVY